MTYPLILAAAASLLTPQQQETLCYTFADLGVATIEAREKGVSIDKIFDLLRRIDDGSPAANALVPIIRERVIVTYAQPLTGVRFTKTERQQLINRFTAECLATEFNDK